MKLTDDMAGGGAELTIQQELAGFDCADMSELEALEAVNGPRHTGQRIKRTDPRRYDLILTALKEGMGITKTMRLHRVGQNTVYAIIDADYPGGRAGYDATMADQMAKVSRLCAERLEVLIPACEDPTKVAVVMGITEEKLAARRGTPSLTVRHEHVGLSARDELAALIQKSIADARERQVTGRIVEETTHSLADAA